MKVTSGIWYKLRIMSVSLYGPTYIYGYNMSVIHDTQQSESTSEKKSNSICCHAVHESVAMGDSITRHVSIYVNPSDIMYKGRARRSKAQWFDCFDAVLSYLL